MNRLIRNRSLAVDRAAVGAAPGWLVLSAFASIYIIWGTTYLAMAIAVETIPPFVIAGSRFVLAGTLLIAFLRIRRIPWPTYRQWKSATAIGCLLMIGGNGSVMWGIQQIPSGICAVIIATLPLWMTFLDWVFFDGPRPGWKVACGLLLGLFGIVLLVGPTNLMSGHTSLHLPSLMAVVGAPIFWSLGSLHSRRVDLPSNVFMSTGAQMLCGGIVLSMISLALREPWTTDWNHVSGVSIMGVLYLSIFGSIVALSAYMWLLRNAVASRVATYTFINPVIAVFLGWMILDEPITPRILTAITVIIGAVALIVLTRRRPPAKNPAESSSTDP